MLDPAVWFSLFCCDILLQSFVERSLWRGWRELAKNIWKEQIYPIQDKGVASWRAPAQRKVWLEFSCISNVLLANIFSQGKEVGELRIPHTRSTKRKDQMNTLSGQETDWSLYVPEKLLTFPSPKPTLTLTSHFGAKCWLSGEVGGQFPRNV